MGPTEPAVPPSQWTALSLDGLLSIGWLVLFFLAVAFLVFATMLVGGLLVSLVSLPALYLFPTVRRQLLAFTDDAWSAEIDSVRNWRFVVMYTGLVYAFGFSAIATASWAAETLPDYYGPVVPPAGVLVAGVVVVVVLLVGLLLHRGWLTSGRLRLAGEWVLFLTVVSGLVVAAFLLVPLLLSHGIGAVLDAL